MIYIMRRMPSSVLLLTDGAMLNIGRLIEKYAGVLTPAKALRRVNIY